jgi:hypothetical protein
MENSAKSVEFEAFKESSAANALSTHSLIATEHHPLEQCIMDFPHAGSDGSVVMSASTLPFPTVAVCSSDTVGALRLVRFFDNIVPDVTRLRFNKAGFCHRLLTIQVPHSSC